MRTNQEDPLKGLDDINWSRVKHACFPARDVPILLRAIEANQTEVPAVPASGWNGEDTIDALTNVLGHCGTVDTAAPLAVPFILRLAASPPVSRKAELLGVVGFLAGDYGRMPWERPKSWLRRPSPVFQKIIADAPLMAELLSHAEPEVRTAAAFVIGRAFVTTSAKAEAAKMLEARLNVERVGGVVANILLAMAWTDGARFANEFGRRMADHKPVIRLAAALASSTLSAKNPSAAAIDGILDAPESAIKELERSPWMTLDRLEMVEATGRCPSARLAKAVAKHIRSPRDAAHLRRLLEVVHLSLLIKVASHAKRKRTPILSAPHRMVVAAMIDQPMVWSMGHCFGEYSGLPGTREEWLAVLNQR